MPFPHHARPKETPRCFAACCRRREVSWRSTFGFDPYSSSAPESRWFVDGPILVSLPRWPVRWLLRATVAPDDLAQAMRGVRARNPKWFDDALQLAN